jgi:hypothetical protein
MTKTGIIGLTILLCSTYSKSTACSCIGQGTVKGEIKGSDVVLVGTILREWFKTLEGPPILKRRLGDTISRMSPQKKPISVYEVLVETLYKGKIKKDTVRIFSGVGGGDCGIGFEIGVKYIIYGKKRRFFGDQIERNAYWTDMCTRTINYDQSEIDEIQKYAKKKRMK